MCSEHNQEGVEYDPGEHRDKHCWRKAEAAFVENGSALIGKCPSTLTKEQAKELVNDAEFDGKLPDQTVATMLPERVWNVFEGVIYEAVPTRPGAYHGYPWRGRPGRNRLARPVKRALQAKAEAQGYGREFKDWLAQYDA